MPNKKRHLETVVFSQIEQEVLSKLTNSKLLTLKSVVSKGFVFNQDLSEYNTFANEEDVDKEIIDTYINQGIIDLSILRDLNFSFKEEDLINANFQSDEIYILKILELVFKEGSQEVAIEIDNIRSQLENAENSKESDVKKFEKRVLSQEEQYDQLASTISSRTVLTNCFTNVGPANTLFLCIIIKLSVLCSENELNLKRLFWP